MKALVLYSKAAQEITQDWLERNVPPGTTVRAIPLPGFMLHDDRSSVSVRVFPPEQGTMNIERLRTMRGRRPPEALLAELAVRPLVVEVDLRKDERKEGTRHPIARSITKALGALVEHDNRLYDEDFTDLSGSFTLPSSGAPPYDPRGPVDYQAFVFDGFCWVGHVDVPWLGGKVAVMVEGAVEPIPSTQRTVVERVCTLPETIRASLQQFLFDRVRSKELRRTQPDAPKLKAPSDIWSFVSQPTVTVPEKPKPGACFTVSFECTWDEEHGISVLFDDRARPMNFGAQGDF